MLPDLPGAAAVEQLRPYASEAAVVYLSGHLPEELAHSAIIPRDAIFLQKPFELEQLRQVVRAALLASPRSGA